MQEPAVARYLLTSGKMTTDSCIDYENVRRNHFWKVTSHNDNDNDNDNFLFDHNLQIEITLYNSLENQIINILVWRLLLRQNNLSLG